MRAELCPVCGGTGQVPSDFYGGETTTAGYMQCRSCHGSGYILVPETQYIPYPYTLPYPYRNPREPEPWVTICWTA